MLSAASMDMDEQLSTRTSTTPKVRHSHHVMLPYFLYFYRMPAARVRRALPNLTVVGGCLRRRAWRHIHMVLAATGFACVGRQHQ